MGAKISRSPKFIELLHLWFVCTLVLWHSMRVMSDARCSRGRCLSRIWVQHGADVRTRLGRRTDYNCDLYIVHSDIGNVMSFAWSVIVVISVSLCRQFCFTFTDVVRADKDLCVLESVRYRETYSARLLAEHLLNERL